MRILVTGSRDWDDRETLELTLGSWGNWEARTTLVYGACPTGADRMAADYAAAYGWIIEAHPADWSGQGRAAGPIRNAHMVSLGADICLAFIKDGSRGATGTATLAERAGIKTVRYTA